MKTTLRSLLLGTAMLSMAGCNSLSSDALQTIHLAISGPKSQVSIDRVQAIDGSVMTVRLGAAEAMLVSGGQQNVMEWYGVTEMLLTEYGRITQTAGLPFDIIAPLATDDPFSKGLLTVTDGLEVTRLVDYPAQHRTGLRQTARYQRGPTETLTFMGQNHQLQRIDERIEVAELNFKATNQYWLEPGSGVIRRSTQHISPDLPPLHLTWVKIAGGQP